MEVDYVFKRKREKSKTGCVILTIVYLLFMIMYCICYAKLYKSNGNGNDLRIFDIEIILSALKNTIKLEAFRNISFANIKLALLVFGKMWFVHLMVIIVILKMSIENPEYAYKGVEQGSARYGTEEELKYYADPDGLPVAKDVYVTFNDGCKINNVIQRAPANYNKAIMGMTGMGKSDSCIKPDIMQCNMNYFIIDPKMEMSSSCAYMLKKNGYKVRFLNLVDLGNSHRYNPYKYITSETDLLKIGNIFMEATKGDTPNGKDFWSGSAENLFTALMMYVYKSSTEKIKCLERIVELISSGIEYDAQTGMLSTECTLAVLMEKYRAELREQKLQDDLAIRTYDGIKTMPQVTLGGIIANLIQRLALWNTKVVSDLTCEDEMDFDDFLKPDSKIAIFVITPPSDTTFSPIVAMIFGQIRSYLQDMSMKKHKGSLPKMLSFEMDEICNIPKIKELKDMLATIRGFNMRMTFVVQSLSQLEAKYPKESKDIIQNCGIKLYIGTDDPDTNKYVAEDLISKTTFKTMTKSYSKNGSSEQEQNTTRLLITPDELKKICEEKNHKGKCVFFIGFSYVFVHAKISAINFRNGDDVYFKWASEEQKERTFTSLEEYFKPINEDRRILREEKIKEFERQKAEEEKKLNEKLGEEFEKDYNAAIAVSQKALEDSIFYEENESYSDELIRKEAQQAIEKNKSRGAEEVAWNKDSLFASILNGIRG